MAEAGRPEERPYVVAILGMHRSGTSWLAGSLESMGLELGDVSTQAPNNPRGSRETKVLQNLHDDVLRSNDGSWSSPPASCGWLPGQRAALEAFVDEMDALRTPWGFKDPRTLLLLDEWREVVGDRLRLVGIFRHPELVARSLRARRRRRRTGPARWRPGRRWTGRRGHRLWVDYNRRLVAEHRRAPFPLIRFDQPRDDLLESVALIGCHLGLSPGAGSDTFFDAAFVNETSGDARVNRSCRGVWDYLVDNEGLPS